MNNLKNKLSKLIHNFFIKLSYVIYTKCLNLYQCKLSKKLNTKFY